MTDLVTSFMGDTELLPAEPGEKLSKLQLLEPEQMTKSQAQKMDARVLSSISEAFEELRNIRNTKAFTLLGFSTFESYIADVKRRAAEKSVRFEIDINKFYRMERHEEVCTKLLDMGVNKYLVGNLLPSHTEVLHAELPEALWQEAIDRLVENKAAHKPIGKAAQFDHMFKFTAEMIRDAVARVNQRIASELPSDPFGDSPANVEPAEAIFDATDDGRIVVDAALVVEAPEWVRPPSPGLLDAPPVPSSNAPRRIAEFEKPPAPVMPNSDKSQFQQEEKEICLAFVGVTPHEMDDDVVWVSGTDGPSVYVVPVRKSVLRGLV